MVARAYWNSHLNSLPAWKISYNLWLTIFQSFIILWIRVLIISPQVLVQSYSILFVAKNISIMTRMQTKHPSSISVIPMGTTLALAMLLLVWQPMSLKNNIWVQVIPCWWSQSSKITYQMHSIMLATVGWLISCTWHGPMMHSFTRCTVQRYFLSDTTILMKWAIL